ncbi:hypothetical protein BH09PLA1_BH09PLA1_06480 [soil metagenome]
MAKNFYSGTDAELASGSSNVVALVTPAPATFGVSAALLTSYTTLTTNFNTLLAQTDAPATRTPVLVEQKNAAKKLLKTASANLAKVITGTPTVTNAQLLSLRMNERLIPTPRPVPSTPPTVEVISVSGRLVNVRVHDTETESRGLPFGATGANLYTFVGPSAPTDPRAYHYEGVTTRSKAQIIFPDTVPSGSTIWISAQWVSARGQLSIGSTPISFTLQGGAIPAAA